ncbi:MAG: chromosome segregation ATPase, partial [Xenococcaceae cyanobacterium]
MTSNRENANADSAKPDMNFEREDSSSSELQNPLLPADRNKSERDFPPSSTSINSDRTQAIQMQRSQLVSILQSWQLWGILVVLVAGSVGFTATSFLLKLPKTPDCTNVFWPIASASMRLYCAQLEANKNTGESLMAAIDLVKVLPQNHPLHDQVEHNVEKWATEILNIGEQKFQEGNIKDSIAMARKIPENLEARKLVNERIDKWQTIWSEAEKIYNKADQSLRDADWNQAFLWAVQLTNVQNRYWATTQYEKTVGNIKLAQEETAKVDLAFAQLRRGGMDNIIGAIEKAQAIGENSYAYKQAQNLIIKGKEQIVTYLQKQMQARQWDNVLSVVNRLPSSVKIAQVEDWTKLAGAGSSADLGTVGSIEDAIAQASKIEATSPLYDQAQGLIGRWKLEIEDVARLAKARELAQPANINDFRAAIAEAKLVPNGNPRYSEAQKEIASWNGQIRTIQDRPLLDRAQELSLGNSPEAWQQAIAQASAITSGSPLYDDAQRQIATWTGNIQRIQDQPILDQADALASQKDYGGAIEVANRIGKGRALSGEVRRKVRSWRREIFAREALNKAYISAQSRTPEAL